VSPSHLLTSDTRTCSAPGCTPRSLVALPLTRTFPSRSRNSAKFFRPPPNPKGRHLLTLRPPSPSPLPIPNPRSHPRPSPPPSSCQCALSPYAKPPDSPLTISPRPHWTPTSHPHPHLTLSQEREQCRKHRPPRCGSGSPPRQGLTLFHFTAQPKNPFWSHIPVTPCLIRWGENTHPTCPKNCAYVDSKSGRVLAPAPRLPPRKRRRWWRRGRRRASLSRSMFRPGRTGSGRVVIANEDSTDVKSKRPESRVQPEGKSLESKRPEFQVRALV